MLFSNLYVYKTQSLFDLFVPYCISVMYNIVDDHISEHRLENDLVYYRVYLVEYLMK